MLSTISTPFQSASVNVQTLLLGSGVFLAMVWLLKRRSDGYHEYVFPPGPRGLPLVGNMFQVRWSGRKLYEVFADVARQYGEVAHLKMGPYHVVSLNSPGAIREAFAMEEFSGRPNFLYMIHMVTKKKGIIMSQGEPWKQLRRFTLSTLRDFGVGKKALEQRIQEEAGELVGAMATHDGHAFETKELLNQAVSNIICSVVFGDRYDYADEEFIYIMKRMQVFFRSVSLGYPENFFPWLRFVRPNSKKRMKALDDVNEELKTFVRGKIDQHRSTYDPKCIRDFIDLYIQTEQQQEQSDIFNEPNVFRSIVDLFNAGTETTATTLTWILMYLIRHPDVQDRCRQEVLKVVGSSRAPVLADRDNMPYTDAVIHETLRVASIVPMGIPHTTMDTVSFRGFVLPPKTIVFANIHYVHHDPSIWTEPETFRPDRWIGKDGKFFRHEAFFPFSAGKRSCLGEILARMELFIFTATLLQRLQFTPGDPDNLPSLEVASGGDVTRCPTPFELRARKI